MISLFPLSARSLVQAAGSRLGGRLVGIDVFDRHATLTRDLRGCGLRRERELIRMVRCDVEHGPLDVWHIGGDVERVFAVAGPEWG